MNSDSSSSSTTQSLCVKGCGFFGSSENRNMCSKCYRDYLKEELVTKTQKSVSINKPAINTDRQIEEKSEKIGIEEVKSTNQRKNRCENCNKKVGLMGFNCRCGKLLCGTHRYPKEHDCGFDFKSSDRVVLAKQNVLVKADKLDYRI